MDDLWHQLDMMGEAIAIEWYVNIVVNTLPSDYRLAKEKQE